MIDREEQLVKVAEILKILAHPLRLGLVCKISEEGEMHVNALGEVFPKYSQPFISQQLKNLKEKGILRDEKKGLYVYYSLKDPKILTFMQSLHALYCKED